MKLSVVDHFYSTFKAEHYYPSLLRLQRKLNCKNINFSSQKAFQEKCFWKKWEVHILTLQSARQQSKIIRETMNNQKIIKQRYF